MRRERYEDSPVDDEEEFDDEPVSKRPKRPLPVWGWVLIGLAVLVAVGGVGVWAVGVAKQMRQDLAEAAAAERAKNPPMTEGEALLRFKDHPETFDGEIIRGKFQYQMSGSIRDTVEKQVVSFGTYANSSRGRLTKVDIWVWCPRGLEYPNLTSGDEVVISFSVAEKGTKLTLLSIAR